MASVNKDSKGWRVTFSDSNKKRRQFRLGKFSKKQAQLVCSRVESIVSAQSAGTQVDPETARWLRDLPAKLYEKLASLGLVQARESSTLGEFTKDYRQKRSDVKESTQLKWQSAQMHLNAFFGEEKHLQAITAGDADEFRLYLLEQELAENSVRRYCGIAKQFFGAAVKKKLIEQNPFSDVVAAVKGNKAKYHFLSRQDSDKILIACPDLQWKLIFILARYGGLRCPSEVLRLKWTDIDWKYNFVTVHSPKTEHHEGKESRIIPLFPEMKEWLLTARKEAGKDSVYVITRYRQTTQNLRTTFLKIIKRAGLEPWPKLIQNLRSTRQTELCDTFPAHVVCEWMGNSERVAKDHYFQITDRHFQMALLETTKIQPVATLVATNRPERRRMGPLLKRTVNEKSREIRGHSSGYVVVPLREMGAEGLEPPTPSV
jgi:integrase